MCATAFDPRFFDAAMDGLREFRRTEFTAKFLREHDLPMRRGLEQMWSEVETWLDKDEARCRELINYVDNVRMWGRQCITLFDMKGGEAEQQDLVQRLSVPHGLRRNDPLDNGEPLFAWDATEPFVAQIKRTTDEYTKASLLTFKIIERRAYNRNVSGVAVQFEQRAVDFFIVNLKDHYAELRLQKLPDGACVNLTDTREMILALLGEYLDMEAFEPVRLQPVMTTLLRQEIYPVTWSHFKASDTPLPETSTLMIVVNRMFRYPVPTELSAYWECDQDFLGKEAELNFTMNGNQNVVSIAGLSHPDRVRDVLAQAIGISRGIIPDAKRRLYRRGAVDGAYRALGGEPRAQATVLSVGAIAASIIWVILGALDEWFQGAVMDSVFQGVPPEVAKVAVEILWIWFYYGWDRIRDSFRALLKLRWLEILRLLREYRRQAATG